MAVESTHPGGIPDPDAQKVPGLGAVSDARRALPPALDIRPAGSFAAPQGSFSQPEHAPGATVVPRRRDASPLPPALLDTSPEPFVMAANDTPPDDTTPAANPALPNNNDESGGQLIAIPQSRAITAGSPRLALTQKEEAASIEIAPATPNEPQFVSKTDYAKIPWTGKAPSTYTFIFETPGLPRSTSGEEAITRFQAGVFEELTSGIGIGIDYRVNDSIVSDLQEAFGRYGLELAPLIFTSFQNAADRLERPYYRHEQLVNSLRSNAWQVGIFHPRYGIAFVNTDHSPDINDRYRYAAHEAGGHGVGYNKYLHTQNPEGLFFFADTNVGAKNAGVFNERGESIAEEAIAEWRSDLVVESIGRITPTRTQQLYFGENQDYGCYVKYTTGPIDQRRMVAVASRYNQSNGEARSYAPLATAIDMLVNRDPANPDRELFKNFFYANVSREALQQLMDKIEAIDPELRNLFFGAFTHSDDLTYVFNGNNLALYMHNNIGPWIPKAVEEAAAVTRGLLPTLHINSTNKFESYRQRGLMDLDRAKDILTTLAVISEDEFAAQENQDHIGGYTLNEIQQAVKSRAAELFDREGAKPKSGGKTSISKDTPQGKIFFERRPFIPAFSPGDAFEFMLYERESKPESIGLPLLIRFRLPLTTDSGNYIYYEDHLATPDQMVKKYRHDFDGNPLNPEDRLAFFRGFKFLATNIMAWEENCTIMPEWHLK